MDRLAADRRRRYAARKRQADIDAERANQRRQDHAQRLRMIRLLSCECTRCGLGDPRGLVIVQPAGERLKPHQLYTLVTHELELARSMLRVLCATCRQIERYHDPSVAPSMSSADVHPSASDDQPSFSSGSTGLVWGCADADGVSFG